MNLRKDHYHTSNQKTKRIVHSILLAFRVLIIWLSSFCDSASWSKLLKVSFFSKKPTISTQTILFTLLNEWFSWLRIERKLIMNSSVHGVIQSSSDLDVFLYQYALSEMSNHFQQRMSWLPQRWRTQRNAIRHANCKIQWVIKTLNATCTSFGKYVCWSVCSIPTTSSAFE